MAEALIRAELAAAGLSERVSVESAGTGDWHLGDRMDSRARAELARRGYDGSAHRARQISREWLDRFDLVITDMLMPKHDGMEVLLFLEQQPNRPRVLAISGGGSQVSADEAFMLARSKADATLAKPFDNSQLLAAVDKLLKVAA